MIDYDSPIRDADFETAEFEAIGRRLAALERKGICAHGWRQGTPGADGPVKCLDCGRVFATGADADAARRELLN